MHIYDFLMSDQSIMDAIGNACDFFNLADIPVIQSDGVCVWSNDIQTTLDDIFGINREQLFDMGLLDSNSITLAYTHECAHRALQGYNCYDDKVEELACDFFAGLHAELNGIDSSHFQTALSHTVECNTHPDGDLRVKAVEFGKQIGEEMTAQDIKPSLDYCLERFNDFLADNPEAVSASPSQDIGHDISFGSAYSKSEYVAKAENCYKEAQKYEDKALRDERPFDKEHDLEQAKKWRQRGDEYMEEAKYADKK